MSKIALGTALSMLLLAACGSREAESAENGAAAAAEANGLEAANVSVPEQPTANEAGEAITPPDAVSHPDGYLPPVPAEPAGNASAPDAPPPATEDEYTRNGQSGR